MFEKEIEKEPEMIKTKITETRSIIVLRKTKRSPTLADIWAREVGSNKYYSAKFEGCVNVDFLMEEVNVGSMIILRGFMGEYKGKPEFKVYSLEVTVNSKNAYFPSEDAEYLKVRPKNKATN